MWRQGAMRLGCRLQGAGAALCRCHSHPTPPHPRYPQATHFPLQLCRSAITLPTLYVLPYVLLLCSCSQGSCGRLVSLDLSAPPGCPPVYGKHPNRSNRHGYDEKHKTQRRLDRDRDSERGNLTARSGDSPKAARSGRPGAKSTARDQAREQGRGQGPGREQGEEVEAGGLAEMMMSTAAAVYGRAVCKAIAGLPHLQGGCRPEGASLWGVI